MNEKAQVIDGFWLKIIAFVSMAFDHIGLFLMLYSASSTEAYAIGNIFRIVGRLAFPLFLLFLSEGLKHTSNRKAYLFRLFIMWLGIAIFQTIIYSYYRVMNNHDAICELGSSMGAQAFTDLLLYALFVYLLEHENKKFRFLSILPALYIVLSYVLDVLDQYGIGANLYFPIYLRASYSLFGFFIFLGFYYAYRLTDIWVKKGLQLNGRELDEYRSTPTYRRLVNTISATALLVVTLLVWGISYLNWHFDVFESANTKIQNYCLLDCLLIMMYSGKRGYDKKWWRIFEYSFYPLHIAIIAIVFTLIFA